MRTNDTTLPNRPVPVLDLAQYLGLWHEIAHLPLFFQRNCLDGITAIYTQNADGSVAILNACRTRQGGRASSSGIARRQAHQAGALRVTFLPKALRWLPFGWADYWVIDLDAAYQWAVVGSPSRKHLWILSRRPAMPRTVFDELVGRARQRGYAVERLILAAKIL